MVFNQTLIDTLQICLGIAGGLSNLRIHIPAIIQKGQSPVFECAFTLDDEMLYAIKWYRGNYEIFRFVPTESPNVKTFPLEGYNVSVSICWL